MNEELILNVESYSPYVIGAIAYVEQLDNGAKITLVDKNGTTIAYVYDGTDGKSISSIVLNDDYTLTINYTDGDSTTTGSIRGATGASGVYYGDDEPTDPDINVWIAPSDDDELLIVDNTDVYLKHGSQIPLTCLITDGTTPSIYCEGTLWFDTSDNTLKVYANGNWNTINLGMR